MNPAEFQHRLLEWFDAHGRKHLPWQQNVTPYRVWLSEIMLQQTQVSTVIPYYLAFVEKFPDVASLALAELDDVLGLWSGLGYYARARHLHRAAKMIYSQQQFPDTLDGLMALPGVGRSTAGAILSLAFHKSYPILDGNVRRVLARFAAMTGWPGNAEVNNKLWALSASLTPSGRVAEYTQAMMDLGATVCTRSQPACHLCPLQSGCKACLIGRATDFPTPKPGKMLPVKQRVLLVLRHSDGNVLLEKRPPAGIWGGLWSLPEFLGEEDALAWCASRNVKIASRQSWQTHRHTFSHFHLDFTPLILQTGEVFLEVNESGQKRWQDLSQTDSVGLPAPIKQLLQQLTLKETT